MNNNLIAIDIAKTSFHAVSLKQNKVGTDRAFDRKQLKIWLTKQVPSHVVIEACGSSHYWARYAQSLGHTAQLITPRSVTPFRQGHKTDKNDSLAIAVASQQPNIKSVGIKTVDQQALQSISRIRQHLTDNQTAVSNMLRGLLCEFGLTISKGDKAFSEGVARILVDTENGLPQPIRIEMVSMYESFLDARDHLKRVSKQLECLVRQQEQCKQLMAIEGIGPVNALELLLTLGNQGISFSNGREASACIGLTPKQYSTGGVVVLGGIGKKVGKKRLRANLIQGALSVVQVVNKRLPKNDKERWLKSLIIRLGLRRAAVALANKTVRTAWAMLAHGEDYHKPSVI
ncbi:MAG: transposase [Glaciecola sp.]|jgi:transposase